MELLKLLLVDDESIILRGLLETYDWESMGYQVVGAANSGEKALALIEDEEPDVVITDIRMKKISGLELIEQTRVIHPEIKFIVVSAYRDFEYAQKACQGGALAYLVKPVEDEELEKIMQEAYELCMKKRSQEQRFENWKKLLLEDEGNFLGQMVERYLKERLSEQELLQLFAILNKDITEQHYYAAICIDMDAVYKVMNQSEYDAKRYLLFQELEKAVRSGYDMWSYLNEDGSQLYLVDLGDNPTIAKLKLMVEGIRREEHEVISAISNAYAGFGGMKKAYKQVQKLYEVACDAGARVLTVSQDVEIDTSSQYSTDLENQIIAAIRKNSQEKLKEAFEKLVYSLPNREDTGKTYLHRLAIQTEVVLDDSYGMSENLKIGFRNFYGMLSQYTLMKLIDILYKLLGTVIEERAALIPDTTEVYFTDYIKHAISYIQDHLHEEELSITTVSEQIYLNPVYFGRVFRNIMGISFKRYVQNERIARAKKLMLNDKESIAEICVKVGIYNPSYFSQLFKQATGKLPSEYRKDYVR